MMSTPVAFRELDRSLDEDQPPPEGLYVAPSRAIVDRVVAEIMSDPTGMKKHLLFGARGAGKSTQLAEIARHLAGKLTILDIDLDRSGISVSGITALDLLYVIGIAALKAAPLDKREGLFDALAAAYAGPKDKSKLGALADALRGLAGFAGAAKAAAAAAALPTGPVGMLAATLGVGAASTGLILRKESPGLIQAASPQGRAMQEAVRNIFNSIRDSGQRPLVVMVDGLEKVNGGASQWFRDTFENTRLIIDLEAVLVVACPPSSFVSTNSAHQYGYVPQVVWGFSQSDLPSLEQALWKRVQFARADANTPVLRAACARFSDDSGGHPRHAISLLKRAVKRAILANRADLTGGDCDEAVQELREWLAQGLITPSYQVLDRVDKRHILPDDDIAAQLFADARILAYSPNETGLIRFEVHPLLAPGLKYFRSTAES